MHGVRVFGTPAANNGISFGRGKDPPSYTFEQDGGGAVSHTQLYTSHVVLQVTARFDPTNPTADASGVMNG